jgi:hypothetical protein
VQDTYAALTLRGRLARRAQAMARSGRYPSHRSIIAELRDSEHYSPTLDDPEFRWQLDQLCVKARGKNDANRT